MKPIFVVLLALSVHACSHQPSATAPLAATTVAPGVTEYGAKMPATPTATPLAVALSQFSPSAAQPQKLSGRIGQVCQAKGCWMMLTDGDAAVRVKFAEHAFAIPKDSQGEAVAFGKLEQIEMSTAQAQHMAEDAGESSAKISAPQKEYRMMATSVQIAKAN